MSNSHFNKLGVEGFKPKAIVSSVCRFFSIKITITETR